MALKLKYTDEHGILHINMSPTSSPIEDREDLPHPKSDITYPKFDTINHRFGEYNIFGGKYDLKSGDLSGGENENRSLFRSRYNSIEQELANTPYAFATDRSIRNLDISISTSENSPSKDIEDDKFFQHSLNLKYDDNLFGPTVESSPAFTVTQLIHAQDRYFDLSSKQTNDSVTGDKKKVSINRKVESAPSSARKTEVTENVGEKVNDAFRVLPGEKLVKTVQKVEVAPSSTVLTPSKKKKESSFAILTETSISSRPSSPRSLPPEPRLGRVSPFRGRGFREETSRHNTPKTSTNNSRANSPPRRRTNSLSRLDKMATAALPPPVHSLSRPHSPRNFVKENIEEIRELSELNREKHEAEAEQKRLEEEEALLLEMGLLEKTSKSRTGSRTTSRSNSPSKINLRSRSNSPSAILHYENIESNSKDYVNVEQATKKPVAHVSRIRSVSRSQPQSNNGSPKHTKIPKRQNSVSPPRKNNKRDNSASKKSIENNLGKNQRFISNSTSSIHETIRIGGTASDRKSMSKSTQHLNISPSNIRGKPPISPGRGGPPPSNKAINPKRLSPIVGTPNKSPVEDLKPGSARTPTKSVSQGIRKTNKTAGNTPAASRLTSRQPSRAVSPDKKRDLSKPSTNSKSTLNRAPINRPVNRTPSTKSTQKPAVLSKTEPNKKSINRTNSVKTLSRTPSTKTLNEKPPIVKRDSKKDLKEKTASSTKLNEAGTSKNKKEDNSNKVDGNISNNDKKHDEVLLKSVQSKDSMTDSSDEKTKQDNETQYDSITNEKGELVILTKKNIVSMTTAAITAQPLEVVTTVTNQLPAALEKAREKGMFERHSSRDSIAPKEDTIPEENNTDDKKSAKQNNDVHSKSSVFNDDNIKLKPLRPPYNNPQVERVKQKIDDILKTPEVSTENILSVANSEVNEVKSNLKDIANKTRSDIKEKREETTRKFTEIKEEVSKQAKKEEEKVTQNIRSEASKIVDSIITPIEDPVEVIVEKLKEPKKEIEPIVTVVNEKRKVVEESAEILEKVNEALVKGDAEVEVQSSNVSTPITKKHDLKKPEGDASDNSAQSNGGFPQSTSTTPKPPARTKKTDSNEANSESKKDMSSGILKDKESMDKKRNICQRFIGKCAQKSKCCSCCVKPEVDNEDIIKPADDKPKTGMSKWSCCKKKESDDGEKMVKEVEKAAGKLSSIEFENETERKRTLRDVFCGCCTRRHRVSDSSVPRSAPTQGCCGRRPTEPDLERRDSILSDRPPKTCCNNRLCNWLRGACRRGEPPSSRRPSLFSKNKSLSPTLPPEDTRPKLDPSLIEHTSVMRGAIPVLPISLAYFCLLCNVLVPGLGTILSGIFCLCFGIPRFGVHDGAKHRIGGLIINILVGCGQLFTVLFCLVGWGWSIWWGVIMVRVSRKYRKLAAEAAIEEAEQAPPVTSNNHHSRA